MGIVKRNQRFLLSVALILVIGAALFGGVVAVRVLAADEAAAPAAPLAPESYNAVSSYGMTGLAPLTVTPTDDTPKFITERLEDKRGIVLLVYTNGAASDMEMLTYFNEVKSIYAADSSFLSFEAHESRQLGDTLMQLRVSDPPILAIIGGDGVVSELYTGWIGRKVMEQRVADAVRGF